MYTQDRWQRIKEIFQSAQERTPAERFDFLNEVCGDDQSIREEVEALLTADDSNENFLSAPAFEFAAGMLADEAAEFSPGQKVDRYEILCPLGAGGMGQIYLAHDEQLGRKIALKLIAREFATDPRRVLRFEQEARAASALNHPNVCVIHDVGVTENKRHFIAMEYIQGVTLRDRLAHGIITPLEALQIAGQVAAALAAAHAAGIVHRDIKPENIMLRPDGYVKVLDFGLAKLTEVLPDEPLGVHASTRVRTEAGTLMGTVKYMSPEQLREAELDERTDIWSLGVVLYEMLTRTTPFEARTPNGTIALIVGPQPPALSLPAELPAPYRDLISRTLAKDRSERYHSITKLATDLNALQRELERQTDTGAVHPPLPWFPPARDPQKTRAAVADSAILTRIKSQALSTAEFIFTEIRTHKAAAVFTGGAGVLALLIVLPYLSHIVKIFDSDGGGPQISRAAPRVMKLLTNAGTSTSAAISPDERYVAHAEEQNGKQWLMLMNVETNGASEVVPADNVKYIGLAFSPHSDYLYFTRTEKNQWGVLYRLALTGGAPVKLSDHVDSPVTFSPNGEQFAFVRVDREKSEHSLMLADANGSNERVLAKRSGSDNFSTYGLSWSPDGRTIVCPAGHYAKGFHYRLMAINVTGGNETAMGGESWSSVYQIAWKPDMSGLIFSAREETLGPHQIWLINYPSGDAERITADLTEYRGVSLAGDKIVTVQTSWTWKTWIAAVDGSAQPTAIHVGQGLTYGITWTPRNVLVYSAMAQDRLDLSRMNPDGSNEIKLTEKAGHNYSPSVSADGRFIVFMSTRNETFDIYRLNADDGSGVVQLTATDRTGYPSFSPDSQWIAYDYNEDGSRSIWKVPFDGGQPVKVAERYRMPVYSPNGRMIAARYEPKSGTRDVAIFPAEGGKPLTHVPVEEMEWQSVFWLDDHTLSFIRNNYGASNIWSYDLNTKALKQVTNFNTEQIFAYAWSPDHKQVACQRGAKIGNVTMISSER